MFLAEEMLFSELENLVSADEKEKLERNSRQ
jgi:hypothetical protein